MKKIALLLAVALLLSLFALAGCTPATTESSEAPAASSEAEPASSEAEPASSEAEPEPASSEAEPEPESSDEPEPEPASSDEPEPEPASSDEPAPSNKLKVPKNLDTLFVCAYNETEAEGAGIVYTVQDGGGTWSHHIAFSPVEDNPGFYEVVEVSYGSSGEGKAVAVPAGGFVYAINAGNNWPELMKDKAGDGKSGAWYDDMDHLNKPNMNTAYAAAAFDFGGSVAVGEIYYIEGVDLETEEIPTSTPDKDYWDPDYVCTAKYGLVS